MVQRKIALYAATPNLHESMMTSCKSLLYYTSVDQVYMMVEEIPSVPEELQQVITFIDVSDQRYFEPSSPNYHTVYTYMALMRPLATKYLPDEDRVLTIDCDAFFKRPGDAIFDLDISNSYFAAVREVYIDGFPTDPYFNYGVIYQNLKKMREDKVDDAYIRIMNWREVNWPEQDVLNILCRGKILEMPAKFNANPASKFIPPEEIIIRHYAGARVYNHHRIYKKFLNMPWDEVLVQHQSNLQNSK